MILNKYECLTVWQMVLECDTENFKEQVWEILIFDNIIQWWGQTFLCISVP